jgi:hypothetical protein
MDPLYCLKVRDAAVLGKCCSGIQRARHRRAPSAPATSSAPTMNCNASAIHCNRSPLFIFSASPHPALHAREDETHCIWSSTNSVTNLLKYKFELQI